jgi:hypothetical protein
MIPHTLVLKPGLVIHSVYNGYWFWGRPSFVDLWRELRTVTREIRPDWDLSKPGLARSVGCGRLTRHFTDGTSTPLSRCRRLTTLSAWGRHDSRARVVPHVRGPDDAIRTVVCNESSLSSSLGQTEPRGR